jgi:hypothetical protein
VSATGWFFIGLMAGLGLDALLKRVDGSRAKARKDLGSEMKRLAYEIERTMPSGTIMWPEAFLPRMVSASLKAKNFGLWFPQQDTNVVDVVATCRYLWLVGTLLFDGHFSQAKAAGRLFLDADRKSSGLAKH